MKSLKWLLDKLKIWTFYYLYVRKSESTGSDSVFISADEYHRIVDDFGQMPQEKQKFGLILYKTLLLIFIIPVMIIASIALLVELLEFID